MKDNIPSWEYVAGFYDGEGCFRVYPYKNTNSNGHIYTGERPFVVVSQVKDNNKVLHLISNKFKDYDIKHSFYEDKYKEYKHIGRPMSVIQITDRRSCKVFIEYVLPFLIIKKEEAKIVLTFCRRKLKSKRT